MTKSILTGFIVGLIANACGVYIYVALFSDFDIKTTLETAWHQGFFGSLIAIGAVLNLVAFFILLKQNKIYEARGVLLATIIAAILIVISKFG